MYTLSICKYLNDDIPEICSTNVMSEYHLEYKLATLTTPYYIAAVSYAQCRYTCESSGLCKYMWLAPDGTCRLFPIGTLGTINPLVDSTVLTKHCGGQWCCGSVNGGDAGGIFVIRDLL